MGVKQEDADEREEQTLFPGRQPRELQKKKTGECGAERVVPRLACIDQKLHRQRQQDRGSDGGEAAPGELQDDDVHEQDRRETRDRERRACGKGGVAEHGERGRGHVVLQPGMADHDELSGQPPPEVGVGERDAIPRLRHSIREDAAGKDGRITFVGPQMIASDAGEEKGGHDEKGRGDRNVRPCKAEPRCARSRRRHGEQS